MITKILTVTDANTEIRVLAIKFCVSELDDSKERQLLYREGYGSYLDYVVLTRLSMDSTITYQANRHESATMRAAHEEIQEDFDSLQSGDTVDVEQRRAEIQAAT